MKPAAPVVLYEDNHLLAMDKAPGLLSQPRPGDGAASLEELARDWVRLKTGKTGVVFLHAVHRLDRVAGGVVLFARTGKALARLNQAMRNREMTKIYQALVEGEPPAAGRLVHWLRHGARRAEVVATGVPGGKEAILDYRLLAAGEESLVEIALVTGRYHQIRAQFAAAGFPVVGDTLYGGRALAGPGIRLHHARLEFLHPVRRTPLVICSRPPFSSC